MLHIKLSSEALARALGAVTLQPDIPFATVRCCNSGRTLFWEIKKVNSDILRKRKKAK